MYSELSYFFNCLYPILTGNKCQMFSSLFTMTPNANVVDDIVSTIISQIGN